MAHDTTLREEINVNVQCDGRIQYSAQLDLKKTIVFVKGKEKEKGEVHDIVKKI